MYLNKAFGLIMGLLVVLLALPTISWGEYTEHIQWALVMLGVLIAVNSLFMRVSPRVSHREAHRKTEIRQVSSKPVSKRTSKKTTKKSSKKATKKSSGKRTKKRK